MNWITWLAVVLWFALLVCSLAAIVVLWLLERQWDRDDREHLEVLDDPARNAKPRP
jgi:cytochrome c-type biogenesis protein CcmH/NrfF